MKRIASISAAIAALSCNGVDSFFMMENDTFLKKNDSDYTHGTHFEVVDERWHYSVGQTMYTPNNIRLEHHVPGDRPYAGLLIGGIGYEPFFDAQSPWTHYTEVDFGMIGPAAMCKDTQTAIHKLLNCRKPQGWDDQLHNEFVVNGQWWTKYNWYLCKWIALVPKAGAAAGNIQDFGEAGADLKIGWNIRKAAKNEIIFSGSAKGFSDWKEKLSLYTYVGASERYYLYNHLLEGSMFGHRDDDLKVDIERFVTELRCGVVMMYDRFFATYYAIFRTDEYRHQKDAPDYGGIGLGWTW